MSDLIDRARGLVEALLRDNKDETERLERALVELAPLPRATKPRAGRNPRGAGRAQARGGYPYRGGRAKVEVLKVRPSKDSSGKSGSKGERFLAALRQFPDSKIPALAKQIGISAGHGYALAKQEKAAATRGNGSSKHTSQASARGNGRNKAPSSRRSKESANGKPKKGNQKAAKPRRKQKAGKGATAESKGAKAKAKSGRSRGSTKKAKKAR